MSECMLSFAKRLVEIRSHYSQTQRLKEACIDVHRVDFGYRNTCRLYKFRESVITTL